MIQHRAEPHYSRLMAQVARELQYWRQHEAEHARLPGGGLEQVWPQCVAIYAIALRSPHLDEADSLLLALRDVRPATLSEHDQRQIFALVWERTRQIRNDNSRASSH